MLSDLGNEIKWSNQKTIMFQAGIIKACITSSTDGLDDLRRKVEELENKITNNSFIPNQINDVQVKPIKKEPVKSKKENISKKVDTIDNNSGNSEINWANIINILKTSGKIRLFTSLANTKINQQGDMILEIIFPNGLTPFVQSLLQDSANKKELSDILFKETGKEWHIKLVDGKKEKTTSKINSNVNEGSINDLGIDINIIE